MATPSCVYKIARMGAMWIGMKCIVRLTWVSVMNLIVDADDVDTVKANLESRNEAVYEIGRIVAGEGPVVVKGRYLMTNSVSKKRLALFASGRGSMAKPCTRRCKRPYQWRVCRYYYS